jgi:hypothetical protein
LSNEFRSTARHGYAKQYAAANHDRLLRNEVTTADDSGSADPLAGKYGCVAELVLTFNN